jgi:hypothetical protein
MIVEISRTYAHGLGDVVGRDVRRAARIEEGERGVEYAGSGIGFRIGHGGWLE